MKKKIISCVLIVCIFASMGQMVSASSVDVEKTDHQVIFGKVAYVEDVNATGTNLNNDVVDGDKNIKADTKLKITTYPDNSIVVTTDINGNEVTLTGIPAGRSQNSRAVFFEGQSSDPKYSVVNFSYEENMEDSSMYFTKYKEKYNSKSTNILKIYLKENDSRNYVLLETFDYNDSFDDEFINSLPENSLLGAWTAREFEPIDSYFGEDNSVFAPMALTSTKYWVCTKTFFHMGEDNTHTIRWRTSIDYSDVPVGQEAYQYFRLTVYDKTSRYSVNTNLNSDSQSYLHVDALTIDQASIPYTAWKSTKIDGNVQNNGWGGELSASIGVNYGVLSLSYSFPISFSYKGYVDIDDTYTSYENASGNYTRNINTEMDSDFKLTQEGHYFEVRSALRDYGNATRSSQLMKSRFHVDIINAGTMEVFPLYCDHNVYVGIN